MAFRPGFAIAERSALYGEVVGHRQDLPVGVGKAGLQQFLQTGALGELIQHHRWADDLRRCGDRGIPDRRLLGIKAFGGDELAGYRVKLADAYLLVARLPEFLVPYGYHIVDIGDAVLLIGLVHTVCHAFLLYRRNYNDKKEKSQGFLVHKLIHFI